MPHVTSVIFDLGGVLLHWDTRAIAAAAFGDPQEQEAVHRAVFEHPDWLELDRGTLDEEEAVRRFAGRSGQPEPRLRELMEQVRAHLSPQPESVALLADLRDRGVRLYCLSNMHARSVAYLQQHHAFLAWFDGAVFSALVRRVKPDPWIYRHLLGQHGLDPAASAFVDDTPENVEAARRLGLHGVLFTSADACRLQLEPLLAPGAAG
ncbi:MAG: HAD family phosphatase [Candidatus Latescibacterota bacterium]